MSRRRLRLPAALAASALVLGCDPTAPDSAATYPRLVVLYATCSVNKHSLQPYAPDVLHTPHIARFALDALVFDRHQTESGLSGISFASIFAGAQATGHGVYAHPQKLEDSLELIGETFAKAGWETWSFHPHSMAGAGLNYQQGVPEANRRTEPLFAGEGLREILDALEANPQRRILVTAAFEVSHWPYKTNWLREFCANLPEACSLPLGAELRGLIELYESSYMDFSYDFPATRDRLGFSADEFEKYAAAVDLLYRSNIWNLDRIFGGVVEAIRERGLLDETVIAFTADHGEVMYRENALFQWTHGHALAPEVIGVPLLIRAPGVSPGRFAAVTTSSDVYPTLAGLAGVSLPDDARIVGRDLSAAARGAAVAPDEPAFSHTALVKRKLFQRWREWERFRRINPGLEPDRMWVSARFGDQVLKLRYAGEGTFVPEVFDHASDPGETENLYDSDDPLQRTRFEQLRAYKAELVADYRARRGRGLPRMTDADQREMLRALGYVQ